LTLDNPETVEYLEQLDKESRAIRNESMKLSWWMRGGATYEDIIMMSRSERDMIGKLIEDNMEATKKSGLPFF
jgi:hypothetical protein